MRLVCILLALVVYISAVSALAGDWPQWGGRAERNMVSDEKNMPETFNPGKLKADGEVDMSTTKNVLWAVRLGNQTYGNPTVAGGKVFVGTNNAQPRDSRRQGDRGVTMCFDTATGKFLWQLVSPKIRGTGNFWGDFAQLGICSSPTIDGDRVYVTTNCCEVVCMDVNGLANGNDGPFTDEARYQGTASREKSGTPVTFKATSHPSTQPAAYDKAPPGEPFPKLSPIDADILWICDLPAEVDTWVQDAADCSVLLCGDYLYVCTSNGVDKSHRVLPSPNAPSLVVLDRKTGKIIAADDAGIGSRIFHGEWSSPSAGKVKGKAMIFHGGGDGWCYGFDATPVPAKGKGPGVLKMIWKYDCDADNRFKDGVKLPYTHKEGPSEVIGTPVCVDNRVYVTVGQDSRHGPGKGTLSCIDATGEGDITKTGRVWSYDKINRSFSTPSVVDGLVYVADFIGDVHCLDAKTGQVYWVHKTGASIWGSTMAVDGRLYVGNEKGVLTVMTLGKEKKILAEIKFPSAIYCTPTPSDGVLYIASQTHLYALSVRE